MATADYVIVGAGSAGCVLAARLTEDPQVRVTLLEAGPRDRNPNVKIPAAFGKLFHDRKLDWDFETEPEPGCAGRRLYVPRGKTLGGSSSINAMLYVRGRPLDYALWVEAGAVGWGWDDVLPYFLRAEHNERGASEFHATGGPLNVADQRSPRALAQELIASCEAVGIPHVADDNGPQQDGVSMFQVTQKNGRQLTSTVAEVCAFVRTRSGLPAADIEFHMGAAFYEEHGSVEHAADCGTIAPTLISPRARGEVTLRSADPVAKPKILTNAPTEPEDLASMVAGMRLAREIASTSPLREKVVRELTPGPDVSDADLIRGRVKAASAAAV